VYNPKLSTSGCQWCYHSEVGPSDIANGYALDNQQDAPVPSR
jgi:hypothetical protein